MRIKHTLLTMIAAAGATVAAGAQTVVNLGFEQNPLFEVSTHSVSAALPADSGQSLLLGADLAVTGGSGSYTYLWTDASGAELGSEPTIEVSLPGTYNVKISDTCNCSHDVAFQVEAAGIDAAEIAGLSLRMAGSYLLIDGDHAAVQASIFSPAGAMVLLHAPQKPFGEVSLAGLAPGTYVAQLLMDNGRLVTTKIQVK